MSEVVNRISQILFQKFAIAFSIAVLLFGTSVIQKAFLVSLSVGPRASLFYLPAAVITLGSLVSPIASIGGIFIGALVFNAISQTFANDVNLVLTSLVPAVAALIAIAVTYFVSPRFREFHQPTDRFSQIDAINIFYFCCLYALANVGLSEVLFYFAMQDPVAFPPVMVLSMMFGDITGSFLVFIILNLLFSLYLRMR